MSRKKENRGFVCAHCGMDVLPLSNGSYRNHCPFCLYSKHLDLQPGDRASTCGSLMKPIGLKYNSTKGFQIVHRCMRCRTVRLNKIATNTVQPDDIELLIRLRSM